MSNRRRRSILKSSGRNSLAPAPAAEQVDDDETGGHQRKGMKDTTTGTINTLSLPFVAARKRVSFGAHHIKEFKAFHNEENVTPPYLKGNLNETKRGQEDMDISSGEEYGNDELESMPLSKFMDKTKYGESMAIDETMMMNEKTFIVPRQSSSDDVAAANNDEAGDKTVWGGTMGPEVDLMNQTYAVPPMNLPISSFIDRTIYGGAIEGLEQTISAQTFIIKDVEGEEEDVAKVGRTEPEKEEQYTVSLPSAPLKVIIPSDETQKLQDLPVKVKTGSKQRKRNKPQRGIFGGAITPKKPLCPKTPQVEVKERRVVASASAQTSFAYESTATGSVPIGIDAQTSPCIMFSGKKKEDPSDEDDKDTEEEDVEEPLVKFTSFASQTSFFAGPRNNNCVDAQTSPYMNNIQIQNSPTAAIIEEVQVASASCQVPVVEQEETLLDLPPNEDIAISLNNNNINNLNNYNNNNNKMAMIESSSSTSSSSHQQVTVVERSLAELSLQEDNTPETETNTDLVLSDDLQFFIENYENLDIMEWILLTRYLKTEVLLIPAENWKDYDEKLVQAFGRIPGYWDVLLDQRELLMDFLK